MLTICKKHNVIFLFFFPFPFLYFESNSITLLYYYYGVPSSYIWKKRRTCGNLKREEKNRFFFLNVPYTEMVWFRSSLEILKYISPPISGIDAWKLPIRSQMQLTPERDVVYRLSMDVYIERGSNVGNNLRFKIWLKIQRTYNKFAYPCLFVILILYLYLYFSLFVVKASCGFGSAE